MPPRAPDPSRLDTVALLDQLRRVPVKPRSVGHVANWPLALRSVGDYVTQAPQWMARWRSWLSPYPKPFQRVEFRSRDGTNLSGWLGYHPPAHRRHRTGRRRGPAEGRQGILVVPGMFSSKDNWIQKARALEIFNQWGYHVFAMDLRGFGESKRVYNTGGWREAEDVAAAIETFRSAVPLHKLHIYAESLGASATLIAAAHAAREGRPLVDGGVLAVSPFADSRAIVESLSGRHVGETSELFMVHWFFRQLLRLGGGHNGDFAAYAKAAAKHYRVSLGDLFAKSSPRNFVKDINVPTLILHSDDDPVVPRQHGDDFATLLAQQRNPAVWRLPWGSHCLFEMLDPEWFWAVLRQFFDFHCMLPAPE